MIIFNTILIVIIIIMTLVIFLSKCFVIYSYRVKKKKSAQINKYAGYECGFSTFDHRTRTSFDVHFYIVGILFLVFDVEAALLYPWGVKIATTTWIEYITILIFLNLLVIGFVYEWYKGALSWIKKIKIVNKKELQIIEMGFNSLFKYLLNRLTEIIKVFIIQKNNVIKYLLTKLTKVNTVFVIKKDIVIKYLLTKLMEANTVFVIKKDIVIKYLFTKLTEANTVFVTKKNIVIKYLLTKLTEAKKLFIIHISNNKDNKLYLQIVFVSTSVLYIICSHFFGLYRILPKVPSYLNITYIKANPSDVSLYEAILFFFNKWDVNQWISTLFGACIFNFAIMWLFNYYFSETIGFKMDIRWRIKMQQLDWIINFILGISIVFFFPDSFLCVLMGLCPIALSPFIIIAEIVIIALYFYNKKKKRKNKKE